MAGVCAAGNGKEKSTDWAGVLDSSPGRTRVTETGVKIVPKGKMNNRGLSPGKNAKSQDGDRHPIGSKRGFQLYEQ